VFVAFFSLLAANCNFCSAENPYEASWESLSKHAVPEWFKDAKFGIYTHWGPVTVGSEDAEQGRVQWYGMGMYQPKNAAFEFHRQKFGDQREFGYKDVVKLFRAEKFDAQKWASLFAASGAKFAGPVAIHHDNFAMWDSAVTAWDSLDQGPKRDITGELAKAIRGQGMKFIATFHHAFSWRYFEPSYKFDGADPKYADLYCQRHEPDAPPTQEFLDQWLAKVNEVVRNYQPDLIWFDFGLGSRDCITPQYQRRMFADYYNWAAEHGRQVAVAHKHWDIHEHTGIIDFERGRLDYLPDFPWLTDTSVGPWFHQKSSEFKTVDQLVDVLVDIVSKNGCMLLNVGPTAKGEIPPEAERLLLGMGKWLKVNGDAIFATRPWLTYGEGPTRMAKSGGFSEQDDLGYTEQDIRYVQSKDGQTLFAIALGWPGSELMLRSVQINHAADTAAVELLGHPEQLSVIINEARQPVIQLPDLTDSQLPCENAFVFRLTGYSTSLHPEARFSMPNAISLGPRKATLQGSKVRLQESGGRPNIGAWDDANESCHWLVRITQAGVYDLRGEFSSANGPSGVTAQLLEQTATAQIPKTKGWFKPVFVNLGKVKFPEAGVFHLKLSAANAKAWRPVNVWQLQLAPVK
jgi:alpha-L-fucosidase